MSAICTLPVFEIHLGLPLNAAASLDTRLPPEDTDWIRTDISEVAIAGHYDMNPYGPHDVPGGLSRMSTKRVNAYREAVSEANLLAELYSDSPQARIEIEQVLMTDVDGRYAFTDATRDRVTAKDVPAATLVPSTPPFETHYSIVSGHPGVPVTQKISDLIELAESLDITVAQAVRFAGTGQVILTTFFADYEEMRAETLRLAPRYRAAIEERHLCLKVVSERIITCLKPNVYHTYDSHSEIRRSP